MYPSRVLSETWPLTQPGVVDLLTTLRTKWLDFTLTDYDTSPRRVRWLKGGTGGLQPVCRSNFMKWWTVSALMRKKNGLNLFQEESETQPYAENIKGTESWNIFTGNCNTFDSEMINLVSLYEYKSEPVNEMLPWSCLLLIRRLKPEAVVSPNWNRRCWRCLVPLALFLFPIATGSCGSGLHRAHSLRLKLLQAEPCTTNLRVLPQTQSVGAFTRPFQHVSMVPLKPLCCCFSNALWLVAVLKCPTLTSPFSLDSPVLWLKVVLWPLCYLSDQCLIGVFVVCPFVARGHICSGAIFSLFARSQRDNWRFGYT